MTLYDFVCAIVDKRLTKFEKRGRFLLSQTLSLTRVNGKWVANNTPYSQEIKEQK